MARPSNHVARLVCANIIEENEKRLLEARIKNQGKARARQDLSKLFSKLNQTVETNLAKTSEKLNLSCYNTSVTANCWYGPVLGFPPGSWWGIRMDCSRDHMHDPFDADIHKGPFGVVSVCTSHTNMNEDVDFGDFLTLTGQVYREEQPDAEPLICNYKNQIPLRLIRSYNLQDDIAPKTGYRYDGLYMVIGCWIGVATNGIKYNKFALMRLNDQDPPSWSGTNSKDLISTRQCAPLSKSNHLNNLRKYDLRKCSYNTSGICGKRKFCHKDDLPSAKTTSFVDIGRKTVPESSIVTRHVFKKPSNNVENAVSTTVSDQKTLTCLGASTTKTHSTNISIRMGLYESSYNAQDAKKNVSTMYKPSKSIDIAIRTALDMENVRLISKEDNKLIARLDTDKAPDTPQLGENVSCNEYIVTENANEIVCPLKKRKRNLQVLSSSQHSHSSVLSTSLNCLENDKNIIERKEQVENVQQYLDSHNLNSNNESDIQISNPTNASISKNSIATHEKIPKHHDILEMSNESLCAQSIKSLDSLTPDKILNLINKEKHHPLSKLLIGNVIGLTTEECAMLDGSKITTLDSKSKSIHISSKVNLKKKHKKGDNIKENVACLDNRRYCKYSKSKRLSWKVQSDAGKFDKTLPSIDRQSCNEANQKCNNSRKNNQSGISKNNEYLSPFRVQAASLQTIAQHTRSSYDIKTRLRTDKNAMGSMKQDFPDSSIKKSRYKKRDREIANLSIDANFSPVTRGPRNRRLRCKNNTYANKRCYSTFNTVIYPPSKRCKSSFKRKSKLTKVKRASDGPTKNRYRISNALRTNAKDINDSIEKQKNFKTTANNDNKDYDCSSVSKRKVNRIVTINEDDRNISKTSFDRTLRKKLTIPLPHRPAQTPLLHYFHKKQVQKPSTMDATTQCRLISENPEVYVIGHLNDRRAVLKMEWDKYEKLRSESTCHVADDDEGYQICQTSRFSAASTKRNNADSSRDRTSAFVPVTNAFDSDLRIARLRSIGFKPIIEPRSPLGIISYDSDLEQNSTSKVTKRDVAERYDKYASEDDNTVVYMDDELQYQDIEEEDNQGALASKSTKSGARSKHDNAFPEMSRENLESPWHGWKKIVTNNRSYWIGW
ncbi:uncharacterized protein [Anoplolepis gracilipes]|uniref:uncharacterized protein n=1 Tax=Anoplolepis gracilipes TaxID=354296 RepID=UPI003BA169D5